MAQALFRVMTDENVANAVTQQLANKGVDAIRLIDVIDVGTPDPIVLEFAYTHGYTLVTLDKHIKKHVENRAEEGKDHAGVFIGGHHLQGTQGIGIIVNYVVFWQEAINGGAATLEDDVYNRISYIE